MNSFHDVRNCKIAPVATPDLANGNTITKKCDKSISSMGEEFTFLSEDNGQTIRWKFKKGRD